MLLLDLIHQHLLLLTHKRITSATSGFYKIVEGNTEAEVVDTLTDIKVTTEGSERVRVGPAGQVGIGGTNYGTSGQVLTSGGVSAAPTWSSLPPAGGTVQATASGALTDGQLVALNTNGQLLQLLNLRFLQRHQPQPMLHLMPSIPLLFTLNKKINSCWSLLTEGTVVKVNAVQ